MGADHRVPKIIKRDKRLVDFKGQKITDAISKALNSIGVDDRSLAVKRSKQVTAKIEIDYKNKTPTVEDVQDIVEKILIENNQADAAKAYILYREQRTQLREAKKFFGVKDDLKVGVNAVKVLERRYLLKDERGRVSETPKQMFRRVAKKIASVEKLYDKEANISGWEEKFYNLLTSFLFLPNSPTLMNAGTIVGQLSACFVIPVEDSISCIFDAVKDMAVIHQSGGGTGFSFSRLRPKDDVVKSTHGIASGPVSFMKVFDAATDVIKQGGRRRGANMGILRVDHPDIIEFITAKENETVFTNFNISVGITDSFMNSVTNDEMYPLINPRTGQAVREVSARNIFDLIATLAWRTGDPGIVFLDRINRGNPTPRIGEIESTNPCGEQPLLPYESCNLGSINLSKMVINGRLDHKKLKSTIELGVRFLDNVIDATRFPLVEIERVTKGNRKIGLGVMGFAEMLTKLQIPYDSYAAVEKGGEIMKYISETAVMTSSELGKTRGSFPNFKGSVWQMSGQKHMRNATVTTVAPTGTISIIANTSSGIEPIFAVSFVRNVMEGTKLLEVNPIFEGLSKEKGFYSKELMIKLAKVGSTKNVKEIPEEVKRIFVTALDIEPEWHVRMQAAFQKHVDNAVSKTVNLPEDATIQDVRKIFLLAYKLECKGITVYRYGSKKEQVLSISPSSIKDEMEEDNILAESEYSGGCPTGDCF
jgi:ribonucleoside-diphosphate reductase alpha chain